MSFTMKFLTGNLKMIVYNLLQMLGGKGMTGAMRGYICLYD